MNYHKHKTNKSPLLARIVLNKSKIFLKHKQMRYNIMLVPILLFLIELLGLEIKCNCRDNEKTCDLFCAMLANSTEPIPIFHNIPNVTFAVPKPILNPAQKPEVQTFPIIRTSTVNELQRDFSRIESQKSKSDCLNRITSKRSITPGKVLSSIMVKRIMQNQVEDEIRNNIKPSVKMKDLCNFMKWINGYQRDLKNINQGKIDAIERIKVQLFKVYNLKKLECTSTSNAISSSSKNNLSVSSTVSSSINGTKTKLPLINSISSLLDERYDHISFSKITTCKIITPMETILTTEYPSISFSTKTEFMTTTENTFNEYPKPVLNDIYNNGGNFSISNDVFITKEIRDTDTYYKLITKTVISSYTPQNTYLFVEKPQTSYLTTTEVYTQTPLHTKYLDIPNKYPQASNINGELNQILPFTKRIRMLDNQLEKKETIFRPKENDYSKNLIPQENENNMKVKNNECGLFSKSLNKADTNNRRKSNDGGLVNGEYGNLTNTIDNIQHIESNSIRKDNQANNSKRYNNETSDIVDKTAGDIYTTLPKHLGKVGSNNSSTTKAINKKLDDQESTYDKTRKSKTFSSNSIVAKAKQKTVTNTSTETTTETYTKTKTYTTSKVNKVKTSSTSTKSISKQDAKSYNLKTSTKTSLSIFNDEISDLKKLIKSEIEERKKKDKDKTKQEKTIIEFQKSILNLLDKNKSEKNKITKIITSLKQEIKSHKKSISSKESKKSKKEKNSKTSDNHRHNTVTEDESEYEMEPVYITKTIFRKNIVSNEVDLDENSVPNNNISKEIEQDVTKEDKTIWSSILKKSIPKCPENSKSKEIEINETKGENKIGSSILKESIPKCPENLDLENNDKIKSDDSIKTLDKKIEEEKDKSFIDVIIDKGKDVYNNLINTKNTSILKDNYTHSVIISTNIDTEKPSNITKITCLDPKNKTQSITSRYESFESSKPISITEGNISISTTKEYTTIILTQTFYTEIYRSSLTSIPLNITGLLAQIHSEKIMESLSATTNLTKSSQDCDIKISGRKIEVETPDVIIDLNMTTTITQLLSEAKDLQNSTDESSRNAIESTSTPDTNISINKMKTNTETNGPSFIETQHSASSISVREPLTSSDISLSRLTSDQLEPTKTISSSELNKSFSSMEFTDLIDNDTLRSIIIEEISKNINSIVPKTEKTSPKTVQKGFLETIRSLLSFKSEENQGNDASTITEPKEQKSHTSEKIITVTKVKINDNLQSVKNQESFKASEIESKSHSKDKKVTTGPVKISETMDLISNKEQQSNVLFERKINESLKKSRDIKKSTTINTILKIVSIDKKQINKLPTSISTMSTENLKKDSNTTKVETAIDIKTENIPALKSIIQNVELIRKDKSSSLSSRSISTNFTPSITVIKTTMKRKKQRTITNTIYQTISQ